MSTRPTALLVTGGHSHPAAQSVPALREVAARLGLTLVVITDVDDGFAALADAEHSLVIVNALRFTMSHRRYDAFRDEWAVSLSTEAREGATNWVQSGRPLLALHTALVSFDDWPEWGDLIGGRWDWNRSHHPPIGRVEVCCESTNPVTHGLGRFSVVDEWYCDLDVRPGNTVVATAAVAGHEPQPASWLREVHGSRVAVSTLGHDLQSLDRPEHRALLGRLAEWLVESPVAEPSTEEGRHES